MECPRIKGFIVSGLIRAFFQGAITLVLLLLMYDPLFLKTISEVIF